MGLWDRLRQGVRDAGLPPLPDGLDVDNEPMRGRRRPPPVVSAASQRDRFPDTAPLPVPGMLHMDASALMAEGDVLAVGPRDVRQPEAGRHAWVVALWYQVDPLQLRDGGQMTLLPDQVLATLPPACYFCEELWSFAAMRQRCPGRPSGVRR
jgi:hypothetical protein